MLTLVTFFAAAHAADLALAAGQAGQTPVALTYHDVQAGPQPSLLIAGGTVRMDVDVQPVALPAGCGPDCQPQVRLTVRLTDAQGTVVARPTALAMVGEPVYISTGAGSQKWDFALAYTAP